MPLIKDQMKGAPDEEQAEQVSPGSEDADASASEGTPAGGPPAEAGRDAGAPAGEAPVGEAGEGEGVPKGEMTPEAVREQNLSSMPDNLKQAYERVVLAGMKTLYSPETHEMSFKTIQGDGPIDERLGRGAAALMGLLVKESNGTMPPQIIIPAGVELLVSAGDYLKQAGEPVTDDDIGGALAVFVQLVLEQAGADSPEKMQQMLQQAQSGTPEGAVQPGAAPAGNPAEKPAGGGMIASEMGGANG